MTNNQLKLLIAGIMSLVLVLSGCSSSSTPAGDATGGGDTTVGDTSGDGTKTGELNDEGIDTGTAATPTTVAGKVTLSSIVTAKARKQAAVSKALRLGKPGSKAYNKALAKASASFKAIDSRALPSRSSFAGFSNGIVELYNASHPEWIYPVAQTTTDADGIYTLETLINADKNDNAYTDGEKIPGGNYTLLAYTIHPKTKRPYLVALQSVVSEFAGSISGVDLVAATSTAEPTVTTMLGVSKNTDGTQTWGGEDLQLAPNAAVQVAFSIAMNRAALTDLELDFASKNGSTIPDGVWTLSADWLTATYYLKEGESWPTGDTYTLTVYGADTTVSKTVDGFPFTGEDLATFNVFGRSLKQTAVGTFSIPAAAVVDTQAPTAQLSSPTLAQTANPISIITPIRIASNERMDVNGLRLRAEPSLGAQPGVLFVGKNKDDLYEYEFLLGESLTLGTTYTLTVSGGKDLAGNQMNELTASFSTEATSEGIVDTTGLEGEELKTALVLAENQAEVKDVFGKWVRAFSDHNLPQLQSLMSGEFFMEYNAADGFDENDVNRDGVFDFKEFSERMISAFNKWKYCEVEITDSTVTEDINIVGGEVADFAFKLEAVTGNLSKECKTAAPNANFFATLQKVNGAWYVVQASDGIDTRGQEVKQATVLTLLEPKNAGDPIKFYDEALDKEVDVSFSWEKAVIADQEVASYAFIVIDSRNPKAGFALIVPPTTTSVDIPGILTKIEEDEDADGDGEPDEGGTSTLGKVITTEFGFTDEFDPKDGAELYWQVAALGSNTLQDVQAGRETSLPKDVVAISELWRFKIAGEFKELDIGVEANGAPVTFSEFIGGYDVGDASTAKILVTTPRADATDGFIVVDGNTHFEDQFTFVDGVASIDVNLNKGANHIEVMDGVPCWAQQSCDGTARERFIYSEFNVTTTGGIEAVINLDTIMSVDADGVETTLVDEGGWNWYESTDAVSLKISGTINTELLGGNSFDRFGLEVWNDEANARATRKITVDADGKFTVEVEIFAGENWVGIHGESCDDTKRTRDGSGCENFNANLGIATDAGSVYEAPISGITVTDAADSTAVVPQKENWGDGGMWNATKVTGNSVTISGVMIFATDAAGEKEPQYNVGSDGGWMSDRLSVGLDGSFSITIDLFTGWNYVELMDVNGNRFKLDILTEAGKAVIRPEIVTIDGVAFTGEDVTTKACTATLVGTAMEGEVRLNWNAMIDDGTSRPQNFWEEIKTEADADGNWTATVPLVGSTDPAIMTDNFVDVFDKNWNWMGVRVINTADCTYTPPKMAVTDVKDDEGSSLDLVNSWEDPQGGGGAEYGPVSTSAKALFAAFPDGSTVIGVTSPTEGASGLSTTTIEGVVDLGQFAAAGTQVVRIVVEDPASTTGPMAVFSSSADDPMVSMFSAAGGTADVFAIDTAGAFSVSLDLANSPAVIQVLAFEDMTAIDTQTGQPAGQPVAGFELAVNGAVLDMEPGDCGTDCTGGEPGATQPGSGGDGGDMSAIPLGSTVVKISSPSNLDENLADITLTATIDLTQFPLTGDTVARLMVRDPLSQNAPPKVLMSSRADDPVQDKIGGFGDIQGGVFTVDGTTGEVSASLSLDPTMAAEISLMVWADMNLGMDANPEHGYFILVNGAEPPPAGEGPGGEFGGGDNSVKTDSITIEGTSNVAGKAISLELFDCGGVQRYEATAGDTADDAGNYAWVSEPITVYQGRNNIGVSNGPQWFNIGLNVSNNVPLRDPVLKVEVVDAVKDEFGREECGNSSWNAGAVSEVTITGTSKADDGQGEYRADGDFGRFDIVDGKFSFTVKLYDGQNRIDVSDAAWNNHGLNIQATNDNARPQFVALDTTTFAAGTQTVEGTVYASPGETGEGFVPDFVGAGMNSCDDTGNCMWLEFSSDPNAADWGAQPMTLTGPDEAGNYRFSFEATFDGNPSWMNIWADGVKADGGRMGHGLDTPINDDSCSDCTRFWKAGAKKAAAKKVVASRQAQARVKAARSKGNH